MRLELRLIALGDSGGWGRAPGEEGKDGVRWNATPVM
jgi:hypothetical protein